MVARFEKDTEHTFDGFDGSGWQNIPYQMVPVKGKRSMSVVTEQRPCKLSVEDPMRASMGSYVLNTLPQSGPQWGPASVNVPANSTLEFTISGGAAAGRTTLILDDGSGQAPARLWVSVKTELKRTYALLYLFDTVRNTPTNRRPFADAFSAIQKIERANLLQANVKLAPVGQWCAPVFVPYDLGSPLVVTYKQGVGSVISDIALATYDWALAADIRIYCCWDVATSLTPPDAGEKLGNTVYRSCFVEDGTDHFCMAHEVGHALMSFTFNDIGIYGGYHNDNHQRLMAQGKFAPITSFKLDMVEINVMNMSGIQ
jgi:hypothetical protein